MVDVRRFDWTRSGLVPARDRAGSREYNAGPPDPTPRRRQTRAQGRSRRCAKAPPPGLRSACQEAQSDRPDGIVRVRVEEADRLPCPESEPTVHDRHGQRRRGEQGHHVVRAVPGRAVAVPIARLLTRKEPVQRCQQVRIGSRADLDDDQTGRGMRHEDGEQAVARIDVAEERRAVAGDVRQAARRTRPYRELAGVYGKMLRSASRMRPRPPRAGADS